MDRMYWVFGLVCLALLSTTSGVHADDQSADVAPDTVEENLGAHKDGSKTDDQVLSREEEAIQLDGLNVAQMKELREKAEKHQFQAEVDRMMKLIINSLYQNKSVFLRELISNASDALDKIRFLSLTDKEVLAANPELAIRIKADKDHRTLHIIDTGIGMTRADLVNNLGSIAKSGTSEFLNKMQDADSKVEMSDLIGQFGVGFYSAFLVADKVIVTSKNNDDKQWIWESDSQQFSIVEDPRGDTLKRGTHITLVMKEEAADYLETDTLKDLIHKYSQFINFPIYLWASKTETVEESIEDEVEKAADEEEEKKDEDEDAAVEDEADEADKKTKKVEKTVWDWLLMNESKPIWTKKTDQVTEEEYEEFFKSLTKESNPSMAHIHFTAEGEITFHSLLYIPSKQESEKFNKYGAKTDFIKLYVRRVFITDNFQEMMPSYLSFVRGVVDSDDLPLNVSRETLQQNKLLKVIKKKLVRKTLDMIKKIAPEKYPAFWQEYSTNIKLGCIEDQGNRSRLAKLLRFRSSNAGDLTSLEDYIGRMKEKQEHIFYMAGGSMEEVTTSPFVERLLKKGYEVLYLTEAVDEYAISAIPEFEGKKFQNVAKEGFSIDGDTKAAKERKDALKEQFEPLTKWMGEEALKDHILRAEVSERLDASPCALITSRFGWTANMQRIIGSQTHSKSQDMQRDYYLSQKKALEINPRHPLIKELLRRVEDNPGDATAKEMALMMYNTATLRSGYMLKDTNVFALNIEKMMRQTLGVDQDEAVEEEVELPEEAPEEEGEDDDEDEEEEEDEEEGEDKKDEL